MIGFLRGSVFEVFPNAKLLLDVQGVGYEVFIPVRNSHLYAVGTEVLMYTHHRIAEGINDLYGFSTLDEKNFFGVLLGVSGIGPKSALGLLEFPLKTLTEAIENEEVSLLTKAPGLGKKTASRLILDLKGKLPSLNAFADQSGEEEGFGDAILALVSLGYGEKEVTAMFAEHKESLQNKTDEELVKWGLSQL